MHAEIVPFSIPAPALTAVDDFMAVEAIVNVNVHVVRSTRIGAIGARAHRCRQRGEIEVSG